MATQAVVKDIIEAKTWIQKHERILIVALVMACAAVGFNAYLNGSASRAEAKAVALQLIVDNDKQLISKLNEQNAANDKATAEVKAVYQQIIDTLERQNASLSAAVAARNSQLQQTQAAIQTAPLDDVAKTIVSAAKLSEGDVTIQGSNGVISQPGMRGIASQLAAGAVYKQDLADTQIIADNKQKELNKANDVIITQSTQVSSLNNTISALNTLVADGDKACFAKIDAVKKEGRKAKRNWFLGGIVTGAAIVAKILL